MQGIPYIQHNDRHEITRIYTLQKQHGDERTAKNIRFANPDLTPVFDAIDATIVPHG